jgi:hypothetical protein
VASKSVVSRAFRILRSVRFAPANKAFLECLLFQGRTGSYSSFDGGRSAIRLMSLACKSQWEAWQKQCVADRGTDSGPNGCTVRAARLLAQTALKLLGK